MPEMGKPSASTSKASEAAVLHASANLSDALFTTTQQRVLGRLFNDAGIAYTVSELIQATGAGSGAVQRELARLSGSGLLMMEQTGNQKRYRPNPAAPIHDELASIVRKTFGIADPLRTALAPLADRIDAAFVYGSLAKRSDSAPSDIDLMLISDSLGYPDVMGVLHPLTERLGREVNPTIYTHAELHARLATGSGFAARVLAQPTLWLIGGDDDLCA